MTSYDWTIYWMYKYKWVKNFLYYNSVKKFSCCLHLLCVMPMQFKKRAILKSFFNHKQYIIFKFFKKEKSTHVKFSSNTRLTQEMDVVCNFFSLENKIRLLANMGFGYSYECKCIVNVSIFRGRGYRKMSCFLLKKKPGAGEKNKGWWKAKAIRGSTNIRLFWNGCDASTEKKSRNQNYFTIRTLTWHGWVMNYEFRYVES